MGPEDTWDTSQQGAPSITIPSFRPTNPEPPSCRLPIRPVSQSSTAWFADTRHGRVHGWVWLSCVRGRERQAPTVP